MIRKIIATSALALAGLALPSQAALLASWDVAADLSGSITDPFDITLFGGGSGSIATLDTDGTFSILGFDSLILNISAGGLGGATLDLAAGGDVVGTYNTFTQQLSGNVATLNFSENNPCSPSGLFGGVICDLVPDFIDFSEAFVLTPANGLADPITFDLVNDFSFLLGDLGGIATLELTLTNIQLSEIPIPAAAWLFGSALLGMGALKRRKA